MLTLLADLSVAGRAGFSALRSDFEPGISNKGGTLLKDLLPNYPLPRLISERAARGHAGDALSGRARYQLRVTGQGLQPKRGRLRRSNVQRGFKFRCGHRLPA
jgi:hypothetical protein